MAEHGTGANLVALCGVLSLEQYLTSMPNAKGPDASAEMVRFFRQLAPMDRTTG